MHSRFPSRPCLRSTHVSQSRRTAGTNAFCDAPSSVLIATDVVARGMDFANVTTVIQVGVLMDKESCIHRLGRTARLVQRPRIVHRCTT